MIPTNLHTIVTSATCLSPFLPPLYAKAWISGAKSAGHASNGVLTLGQTAAHRLAQALRGDHRRRFPDWHPVGQAAARAAVVGAAHAGREVHLRADACKTLEIGMRRRPDVAMATYAYRLSDLSRRAGRPIWAIAGFKAAVRLRGLMWESVATGREKRPLGKRPSVDGTGNHERTTVGRLQARYSKPGGVRRGMGADLFARRRPPRRQDQAYGDQAFAVGLRPEGTVACRGRIRRGHACQPE